MKLHHKKALANLTEEVRKNKYPRCYDSMAQYKEWLMHEQIAHTAAFRKNVCEDCIAGFKAQMVKENKCINPHLVVKS